MNTQPPSYRARVGDALDMLFRILRPYVEREMRAVYHDDWLREARSALRGKPPSKWDTSDLLTLIYSKYFKIFSSLGHEGRSRVSLLKEVRKKWAHQGDLSLEETRRALEDTILLLREVGALEEADRLEPQVLELMHLELQERMDGQSSPSGVSVSNNGGSTQKSDQAPSMKLVEKEESNGPGGETMVEKGLKMFRPFSKRVLGEPLELRHQILNEVERAVEPHRQDFSFNRLIVHVLAPEGRVRLRFEAALESQSESFQHAVRRQLKEARLPIPTSLNITWKYHRTAPLKFAEHFEKKSFYIELQRRKVAKTAVLDVKKGRTSKSRYLIRSAHMVTIGRMPEVADEKGRLVRRNKIAFFDYEDPRLEGDEGKIQRTVSRAHARICYDEAAGVFRLYDDQSTCGTAVVREGYPVPIQVKQQSIALQDGDLLYFGKACLSFHSGKGR